MLKAELECDSKSVFSRLHHYSLPSWELTRANCSVFYLICSTVLFCDKVLLISVTFFACRLMKLEKKLAFVSLWVFLSVPLSVQIHAMEKKSLDIDQWMQYHVGQIRIWGVKMWNKITSAFEITNSKDRKGWFSATPLWLDHTSMPYRSAFQIDLLYQVNLFQQPDLIGSCLGRQIHGD